MPRRNGDGEHDTTVGVLPAVGAAVFEFLLVLAAAWLAGKSERRERD